MSKFDIEDARSRFPALAGDQIFFDNAGGSQTLGSVIDAIRDYLSRTNVQLGATYSTGKLATERYDAGFAAGARYINAETSEIVFSSSTTQLLRNLSFALTFTEGDEIIISTIDHEANIGPWVDLASRLKLGIKWWTPTLPSPPPANPNPILTASSLAPLLTSRTRLVSCTHASNVLGSTNPIAEVAAAVRAGPSPEALVVVDGVSWAPHRPVDVRALGVDVYAFSWYKVYGPHIAMLYASQRAQGQMKSLGHYFKEGHTLEEKIGLAGASYELLHTLPSITSYLPESAESWESREAHEEALQRTLLTYLVARPDVTIYGDTTGSPDVRVSTVSFRFKGWSSRAVVETVEAATNFGFRWGNFYSPRLVHGLLGLGDDGVVRVSLAHYNTVNEVKGFIDALEKYIPQKE
ncbi:aminotransferase class-V [Xylaria bambusicola]|uniref:aminotransferase class-V n=1 Tax=Xylaria bambusicola TaxID=326684 RepID=UPI002008EB19|nr:aminotransferase class-V [Xylaria bambusicola]KAI0523843.1 aminotransferase class-V [Xylaria bambusicola]